MQLNLVVKELMPYKVGRGRNQTLPPRTAFIPLTLPSPARGGGKCHYTLLTKEGNIKEERRSNAYA
jgi:hypothetical protein